jgi:hypothetical protein
VSEGIREPAIGDIKPAPDQDSSQELVAVAPLRFTLHELNDVRRRGGSPG